MVKASVDICESIGPERLYLCDDDSLEDLDGAMGDVDLLDAPGIWEALTQIRQAIAEEHHDQR